MERTLKLARLSTLVAAAILLAGQAAAQPPDFLRTFRFIPSHSTLEVTGGFAGIHQQFFAYGKFGLVTGYEETHSPHALVPHAEFVDVDSWLVPDSPLTYVWDTDQTLDLTGLEGTFSAGDSDRLVFHGVDGQGQPFMLNAVQHGRLLHLVGESQPACCDLFQYRFDALAHLTPYADFNLDGVVDLGDMHMLMSNMGTIAHATFEQGDADGDGDVDGNDFLTWQREIGAATPMSELAADSLGELGLGSVTVPEPGTALLAMFYAVPFLFVWRRRQSQSQR